VRESAFGLIDLVAADAQIGKNTLHGNGIVVSQEVLKVGEVVVYEGKARIVGHVLQGIVVAVIGIQFPVRRKVGENLAGVSATPEGNVHIGAIRALYELGNTFV
jgi:hypothetical protein